MSQIDWSKAPEGATHFAPAFGSFKPLWARLEDGVFKFHSTDPNSWRGWYSGAQPGDGEEFIERPSDNWTGAGLPPVGVDVEFTHSGVNEWIECHVVGYYQGHLYGFTKHWLWDKHDGCCHLQLDEGLPTAVKFRPIRTPEQIAAEEQEKAIDSVMTDLVLCEDCRYIAKRVVDRGYRKVTP